VIGDDQFGRPAQPVDRSRLHQAHPRGASRPGATVRPLAGAGLPTSWAREPIPTMARSLASASDILETLVEGGVRRLNVRWV